MSLEVKVECEFLFEDKERCWCANSDKPCKYLNKKRYMKEDNLMTGTNLFIRFYECKLYNEEK